MVVSFRLLQSPRRRLLSVHFLNSKYRFIYLILLFEMGFLELLVALMPFLLLQILGLLLQVVDIRSHL